MNDRASLSLPRPVSRVAWLPLFCLCLSQPWLQGAERPRSGREIFRQQCSKCHGRDGQGVKGKYADPLQGDWSIEKLTRYIDKKMPDDAPEKCVGADAAEVARYIYDAFYSREARARQHPARVELVRLTNRQYVNTVADLIKSFGGNDPGPGQERGLRGSYRPKSRGPEEDRKTFERLDRQVNLSLGTNSPDAERLGTGTNEFSITWRGALVADETGEHEFVLQTPNGARLWVNDDGPPLIDAGVASGQGMEHRATLRLIGGRAYPLRLEYFKAAKDKTVAIALWWKPPHGVEQVIPARNLSPARVSSTFVVTTPFPPDDSSVGYERGVAVSKAWDEATTQAAIEVANHLIKHLDRLSGSLPKETNRTAKVEAFCRDFVAAAFRRPLSAEQKRLFVSSQFKGAKQTEDAVKRVVLRALKSPRFLYLGLEANKPDDFEVAARLSFGLWDSLPDQDLSKLAAQRGLHSPEQVREQARRMLGDPRTRAKIQSFFQHWLQMNRVDDLSKDAKLYPGFTPEIIADLRTSLILFLEDCVWNGPSDYRSLLLADSFYVNDRLARFYGVKTNVTDDFVKVTLDPIQRSGVVTHPYLLAQFSYQKSTSPIHRGVFLTRNIVGRALRPPPMAMTFKDADFAPNLTMREKVAQLTRPEACQSCHSVINPLGFSLEQYDAVGRFRTQENDQPIDAVADYITDEGESIRFVGARDLAEYAAGSEKAQNAFIEQLFNQVVKQPMLAYGPDVLSRLRQSFVAAGFNMQKLLVDMVTISALHGIEKPALHAPSGEVRDAVERVPTNAASP